MLEAEGRLYSVFVGSVLMLCGSENWPVKKDDLIRIERNCSRMVKWMPNMRRKYKISAEDRRNGLRLNTIRKCLQNRRLRWFSNLERMEKSTWPIKSQA